MKIHYSRKKAEVSQSLQVTFDRDRVTLDLIKEGVTLPNGWALIPEIYPAMVRKYFAFTASAPSQSYD